MLKARLNYVELQVSNIARDKAFYAQAFGWSLADFGPTYAATTTNDVDIGLQADPGEHRGPPLPVIHVDDIEACLQAVRSAGGTIVRPVFSFPGGRRFHFQDPAGNELAVWTEDQ